MQAYLVPTEAALPPWGDPTPSWKVLGRPVQVLQREALVGGKAGGGPCSGLASEPPVDGPVLVLTDDLLVSREFVADFLAIAATRGDERPLIACLGPSEAANRSAGRSALPTGPDGSLPVPMLLWPRSQRPAPSTWPELLEAAIDAEPVVVDPREETREIPVPRAYAEEGKETITAAASLRIALHLRHRTHLLQANLDWMGREFLAAIGGKPKWLLALRYVWERLRPGPRRLFSKIGKGCKIHPTAIVEASSLGAGVEVGAYAIVRASIVGDGASIEDGAHVQMCVLDAGSRVGRQTSVFASVLMEGAHSTQGMMQMSVLGRNAATTAASWFMDVRFDGKHVRVEAPPGDEPGLLDAGTRFLGCDVGHGTIVGAAVLVASGRMLPSNATVVTDPSTIAGKLDSNIDALDAGGATLTIRDGKLEKLR